MSKVSFRARALDVHRPMPVFNAADLPDLERQPGFCLNRIAVVDETTDQRAAHRAGSKKPNPDG